MFYRITGIGLEPGEKEEAALRKRAAKELGIGKEEIEKFLLYRKSVDARAGRVKFVYTVDVSVKKKAARRLSPQIRILEKEPEYYIPRLALSERPVVVGFGPAGIFAALCLARAGLCPVVLERGQTVEKRVRDVEGFFAGGDLNEESNVLFGEGGAGTFSDGKLNTLLKDKNERGRFVLEEFVKAGAPEEILYWNKPHIGTDRLRAVVKNLREEITSLGGQVLFGAKFCSPVLENGEVFGVRFVQNGEEKTLACRALFLAIGHSARDTFRALFEAGVPMEKKIFSVGVRIEHSQKWLNAQQYGKALGTPGLPPADYKLSAATSCGKKLYSFCMCPGGVVVPSAGERGGVVTNGMSNFLRDGENCNAALLFNILPEELEEDLFSGVEFQKELEHRAFSLAGGDHRAPAQSLGHFLGKSASNSAGAVEPSFARGVTFCDLSELFSGEHCRLLQEGIAGMGKILPGFDSPDAVLTAPETRATSPIRILRGENFQSAVRGLYPIGEGAGYAGGILSSAMDGMRATEAFFAECEKN